MEDDDLFEVDLDDATLLHVFESTPDGETTAALRRLGLKVHSTRLGSELMTAAQDGRVSGVVVGYDVDPEFRELFMRAFRGRFPAIAVVYVSASTHDPAVVAAARAEGAALVVSWPLPAAATLLPQLEAVFPLGPTIPVPAPGAPGARSDTIVVEQSLLARKAMSLEGAPSTTREDSVSVVVFEQAVKEVAARTAENTELRSELTIARQRTALLEDRIDRLTADLRALTQERDTLKGELASGRAGAGPRSEASSARLAAVESLVAGVETYTWGLEQAIQYFEELKLKVGARAPSLDVHLRTLKLLRAMLDRLRERFVGPGDQAP